MNDSSFGMVQRFPEGDLRELFSPIACLCNVSTLFLIFGLIADAIYDFFLGWRILCFHLLIKSTLLVGGLLRLDNKQNNTWSLVKFGISLLVFNWTSHEWARWAQRSLVRHQAEYYGFLPSLQVLVVVIFIFERPQYWRASLSFAFNFFFLFAFLIFFWQGVFKAVFFHFPLSFSPIER